MCTRKENQWISCLNWFFPSRYLVLDRQTFQNLIIQIKVNQLKKHCLKREILVAPVAKLFPSLKTPVPLRAQSHSIETFTDGDVEVVTGLSVQREQRSDHSSPPHTALRSGSCYFSSEHWQPPSCLGLLPNHPLPETAHSMRANSQMFTCNILSNTLQMGGNKIFLVQIQREKQPSFVIILGLHTMDKPKINVPPICSYKWMQS